MKTLITFVSGALTGALLLWIGCRQEVVVLASNRLVRLDRFTGEASLVFVSELEYVKRGRAEQAEMERAEKAEQQQAAAAKESKREMAAPGAEATPDWRELKAEEVQRLEFKWRRNGGGGASAVLSFHNPFEKKVRINRVHVQIPALGDKAAIDRMYELENFTCEPLADKLTVLNTEDIDWSRVVQAPEGAAAGASAESPFGTPPPSTSAHARPSVVGSITPVQVMMFP